MNGKDNQKLKVLIVCKQKEIPSIGMTEEHKKAIFLQNWLKLRGINSLILDEKKLNDHYKSRIDNVLRQVPLLVVVGTSQEHIMSDWVYYQWYKYSEMVLKQENPDGQIITCLGGVDIKALPDLLGNRQSFSMDNLLPIVNWIVKHIRWKSDEDYYAFISYKRSRPEDKTIVTPDYKLASSLHHQLLENGINTFFSERDLDTDDFKKQIEDALEHASVLIVVGTKPEYITSNWVRHEWNSFSSAVLKDKKPHGEILTYLDEMSEKDLPMGLIEYKSFRPDNIDKLIGKLYRDFNGVDIKLESKLRQIEDETKGKIVERNKIETELAELFQQAEDEKQRELEQKIKEQREADAGFAIKTEINNQDELYDDQSTGSSISPEIVPKPVDLPNDREPLPEKPKSKGKQWLFALAVIVPWSALAFICVYMLLNKVDVLQPAIDPNELIFEYMEINSQEIAITGLKEKGFKQGGSDLVIPKEINEQKVTVIGDYAFLKCEDIVKIEIPDTVTEIEDYAFSGCTKLKTITIPDSVTKMGEYAFYGCTSLSSVKLPKELKVLNKYTFDGCTSLKSVDANENLITIGAYAFNHCTGLKKFDFSQRVLVIDDFAFNECSSLESVDILHDLQSIGTSAFSDCTSLKSVKIPGVDILGSSVFSGCTALMEIQIPSTLNRIPGSTFKNCSGLEMVYIPKAISVISMDAFDGCINLKSISVDDKNNRFCDKEGVLFDKDGKVLLLFPPRNGKKYSIPADVEMIGENSFRDCTDLKVITFPSSVISIGHNAFRNCQSIEKLKLPGSLQTIGYAAFEGCSMIKEVKIPKTISFLDDYTFARCKSLESVNIPSTVTDISQTAFEDCDKNLKFIGQENSYASQYAKRNKIKFTVDGYQYDEPTEIIFYNSDNYEDRSDYHNYWYFFGFDSSTVEDEYDDSSIEDNAVSKNDYSQSLDSDDAA